VVGVLWLNNDSKLKLLEPVLSPGNGLPMGESPCPKLRFHRRLCGKWVVSVPAAAINI
jgi:hypothetical protein